MSIDKNICLLIKHMSLHKNICILIKHISRKVPHQWAWFNNTLFAQWRAKMEYFKVTVPLGRTVARHWALINVIVRKATLNHRESPHNPHESQLNPRERHRNLRESHRNPRESHRHLREKELHRALTRGLKNVHAIGGMKKVILIIAKYKNNTYKI